MSNKMKSDVNRYQRLKENLAKIKVDIWFLKKCVENQVFPKFVNIKCRSNKPYANKVLKKSRLNFLKNEISFKYCKLTKVELELYELHLSLATILNENDVWMRIDAGI